MALPANLVNLATNPCANTTTGFAGIVGTGGAAALSNVATAGYSGNGFNRMTWSTATTAPSGGMSYTQTGLTAGAPYGIIIYARASKAQTVNLTATFQTAAAATVNTLTTAPVALTANTWTRLAVTGTAGASVDRVVLTAAATAAGAVWAINDTFDLDAVLISATTITRTNSAQNPSFETASGTVNTRTNLCTNPSVEAAGNWATNAGGGGVVATSTPTTGGFIGTSFFRSTWTTASTTTGYVEYQGSSASGTGITAGQVYTFSAYLRSSVATTMFLRVNWWNGSTSAGTSQGANVTLPANVWTLVSLVGATAPTGTTGAFVDWYSTTGQALNQTIDSDAALIEQSPVFQPYFDGANPITNTTMNPDLAVDLSNWVSGGTLTRTFEAGRWWAVAPASTYSYATATVLVGAYYSPTIRVRGTAGTTFNTASTDNSYGNFAASNAYTIPASGEMVVTELSTTYSHGTNVNFGVTGASAPIKVTEAYIEMVGATGKAALTPYYKGQGDFTYAWTGTANASTSVQRAPGVAAVTSYWASANWNSYQSSANPLLGSKVWRMQAISPATFLYGPDGTHGTAVTAGQTVTASYYVRPTVTRSFSAIAAWNGGAASIYGPLTSCPANVWTRVYVTATVPAAATLLTLFTNTETASVAGDIYDIDQMLIEISATLGTYFDGNTAAAGNTVTAWAGTPDAAPSTMGTVGTYFDGGLPPDALYRYLWTGTANASTSQAEYRGVWVESVVGSGCPKVQVTASGLGTVAGNVIITRTADGETWTVPGWMNRSVIDTDTDTDFAPPLGRTVSYTLYFNGQQINSMSLTVTSATGWVQDPYDPTTAMPVNTMFTDRTILTLAKGSLDSRTHVSNASRANVMGAKRPYSISGQRMLDGGAVITLNAWQNTASDSFKALAAAPILLFRGLPSWGSLPGLAYLDGPVQENAVDRYRKPGNNNALTQWTVSGDLIQPVSRKPLTGQVTNDQVQTNLNGVTNTTIAGRSGTKRNIDVKANPLAL